MEWRHTGKVWEKVQVSTVGNAVGSENKTAVEIANKSLVNILILGITVTNLNVFLDEIMKHNIEKFF